MGDQRLASQAPVLLGDSIPRARASPSRDDDNCQILIIHEFPGGSCCAANATSSSFVLRAASIFLAV
jgi:hypothetical protein